MTTCTTRDRAQPKVARDLTEIEGLFGQLHAQAVADASHPLMPGGAAMVTLGPVANQEAWENLNESTERLDRAFTSPEDEDPDDAWSAHQTLVYWSDRWRREQDLDYDHRRTPAGETQFLRWALDWAWHNETDWDAFAADVRAARLKLERILHADQLPDRTRIVCASPTCEKPSRLVKVYARRFVGSWHCEGCDTNQGPAARTCDTCDNKYPPGAGNTCRRSLADGSYCTGRLHHAPVARTCVRPVRLDCLDPLVPVWASHESDDRWKCLTCKTHYDLADLMDALGKQLRADEAQKFLPLTDAIGTLRVQGRPERTVRKWLAPSLHHIGDRCTLCSTIHGPQELNTCPTTIRTAEGVEACGGALTPIWEGDPDAIVGGYCDIDTHRTYVWWPDLWALHQQTPVRRRGA